MEHITVDTWIRLAELLVFVVLVPSIRTLVNTLVDFKIDLALLIQKMDDHVTNDDKHFEAIEVHLRESDRRIEDYRTSVQTAWGHK